MNQIATFHSPFREKFGIPRQAGVVADVEGTIVLNPEYRKAEALRGMEEFDYLWLIWTFSANAHSANSLTVRPPRLGGNKHMGVFATRSPYRPNPIGLSSVRLDHIDYEAAGGPVIHVKGADLMDGTPILDIKPYIPYTDSHPEARGGFTDTTAWRELEVEGTDDETLRQILAQDPRPQYHDNPERIYTMEYNDRQVRFKVNGQKLIIL